MCTSVKHTYLIVQSRTGEQNFVFKKTAKWWEVTEKNKHTKTVIIQTFHMWSDESISLSQWQQNSSKITGKQQIHDGRKRQRTTGIRLRRRWQFDNSDSDSVIQSFPKIILPTWPELHWLNILLFYQVCKVHDIVCFWRPVFQSREVMTP